jgi:ABC-type transport system involved in cytochrome c biogenesis permease subunit
MWKVEQQMRIDEGSYANYGYDIHDAELAVIDRTPSDHNAVVAIGQGKLKPGATIQHEKLPFTVKVDAYYPNSTLLGPMQPKPDGLPQATAGAGLRVAAKPESKANGVGESIADVPSAYVTLAAGGKELGRYLVSQYLDEQQVQVEGGTYDIALRFRRYYKPFRLYLKDFRFDRLTGTDTARNYSSLVQLVDPTKKGEDREVKIWMNHPLRYAGETFFQSSFDNRTEKTTVLQVVHNPSWVFPYISCVVGALGLCLHFGAKLLEFTRKRTKVGVEPPPLPTGGKARRGEQYTLPARNSFTSANFLVPAGVAAFCLLYLASVMMPRSSRNEAGFDFKSAAAIPMNYEGRVLPLDTLARVSLKVITGGREDLSKVEGKPPVMQFLFETFTRSDRAREYRMFKISNSEVIGLMGLNPIDPKTKTERDLFSWAEMEPNIMKLQQQAVLLKDVPPKEQTVYQRKLGELWKQVKTFDSLAALGGLYVMPPKEAGGEWRAFEEVYGQAQQTQSAEPALVKFLTMLEGYRTNSPDEFNKAVAAYRAELATAVPGAIDKAETEVFFNRVAPFYHLMAFYVLAFVLVMVSFLVAPAPLRRAAWTVLLITIVFHTGGLIFRMYLQGRPPVTTLYSSAIFIAWAGVLLALGLERVFKSGIGLLIAAVVGFISLFVAHNLAGTDGDTLRELQAVLDTNFWLATHVVLVTMGYAATFVAGALGITYLVRGIFTETLDKTAGKDLTRMTYGILCFALLFSFVGTVLGGIWADQSWGRFWGWDPKENGAILIVLWNALILHARWSGLAKDRGIALLAVFGNCVTAWSYFGTNELGIGLHAYGFTEGRAFWLKLFAASQVAIIALGWILPTSAWRSASRLAGPAAKPSGGSKTDRSGQQTGALPGTA